MALIDSLTSTTLGLGGAQPPLRDGASADTTTTHVDGATIAAGASAIDLDGATPAKYLDNPPT